MSSDDAIQEASAATVEFEQELQALVLAAFAKGAVIEGEWEFELPVTDAPNWTVEIRKSYSEDADAPEILEE